MPEPEEKTDEEGENGLSPDTSLSSNIISNEENPHLLLFEAELFMLGFKKKTSGLLRDFPDGLCYVFKSTSTTPRLELYVSASSRSDRFTITVDLAEQKRSLRIANTSLADFHLVEDAVNRLLSGKF